ncbi:NosD domain-containing protein [Cytobacillus sp. FJAT-53684]|uniref:NosD domain-containing protein n=1 Tax=Cytobacillus mangrovibacter TaxID=3299024 RepID=A0ABW6K3I0_9BACI
MYKKIGLFLVLFLVVFTGKAYGEERTVTNSEELQEALASNEELTVIQLKRGEYAGTFTINHPVHLIGEEGVVLLGPESGNVLTIEADDVTVEGLQIEGSGSQNAGIYVKGNRASIHQTILKNVFHGIYAKDSYGHRIENNVITSFNEDHKHNGFGIYLVKAPNSIVNHNFIYDTQDGIYVSYSNYCEVRSNQMIRTRYGVHTMDSKTVLIAQNEVRESVNGMMIMQSNEISIIENVFYLNTKIDGAGIFIFDTFDSKISSNIMKANFKGIVIENAKRNTFEFNTFLGNNVGMELGSTSDDNTIYLNNFYHNTRQIISDKDNKNLFSRDNYGNYFDDHGSLNLNNDDLVDFAYKSGDVFYNMTSEEPYLNIFYQSPAVELWNKIEQYTPMPTQSFVIDEVPLVKPAPVHWSKGETKTGILENPTFDVIQILCFLIILAGSLFILIKLGRERREV